MHKYDEIFKVLVSQGYEFKIGDYLRNGFNLFKKYIWGFISFYSIFLVINLLFQIIPGNYWFLLSYLFQPIMMAGIVIVANEIYMGNITTFPKFFESFKFYFELLILLIVSAAITLLGLLLLIVPGIYIYASFYFAPYFVVFLGYDFYSALMISHFIFSKNWWNVFAFAIIVNIISLSGLLLLGVGVVFTVPLSLCITYCAFEDVVGGAIRKYSNEEHLA